MKTTLLFAIALLTAGLMTSEADARLYVGFSSIHRTGYSSCGCDLYQKRVVSGFDRYNRPIYRYYAVPVSHRCGGHAVRRSHYTGGSHYSNSRRTHRNHYRYSTPRRVSYGRNHRNHSHAGYRGTRRITIR